MGVQDWSYLDSAYFSTTTMLTIGYGDYNFVKDWDDNEHDNMGQYIAIGYLPLTVFCTAATLGNIATLMQAARLNPKRMAETFHDISEGLFKSGLGQIST